MIQKQSLSLFNKIAILLILFSGIGNACVFSQCLSSLNPVGGTENLLALQKKSFRFISFYKYGGGSEYFEKNNHSDFNLIEKACYNNLTTMIAYGLNERISLEAELGYFINKKQLYNTQPEYTLKGSGFSNLVLSAKYSLFADHMNRVYFIMGMGIKIPCSRNPQMVDHVELPVELQPTLGAYGMVLNTAFVKENSGKGLRFFITNRVETNFANKNEYQLGTAFFSSAFISKHLMFPWLKGDWTAIMQLRNELRLPDKITGTPKESSGSVLLFAVPQIIYGIKEKWYLSAMLDVPVYQFFNGTQLGAGPAITFSLSRTIVINPA